MLKGFKNFIREKHLFRPEDKLLVAVSGGIDSVVLAHLCSSAGYKFGIAHCNFGLRGKESEEDELFVRRLAEKLEASFHGIRFDTRNFAEARGVSIQMAARNLRYNWFEQIRKEHYYQRILLAHHLNDATETFFINLLRGTGISGLLGIPIQRKYLVRPLLFVNRIAIEKYAAEQNLEYREDSSNSSEKYLRNSLRNRIIPALEKMNPGLEETMFRNMEHLRQVEQVYRQTLEKELRKLKIRNPEYCLEIDVKKLLRLNPAALFLYELVRHFGFNESSCKNILTTLEAGGAGQEFFSATHRILKDRDRLIIVKHTDKARLEEPGEVFYLEKGARKIARPVLIHISEKKAGAFPIPVSPDIAFLDKAKLKFPLILRKWEKGDFFVPLGMLTKKKLSDFFIDAKISKIEKEKTWLLLSGKDVVWVVGHRINELYKVGEKTDVICIFIHERKVQS